MATRKIIAATIVGLAVLVWAGGAQAGLITATFDLDRYAGTGQVADGLAAQVQFRLDTAQPTILEIHLTNISTGVPSGFDSADQILTSVSFDLGAAGINGGDPRIIGGSVVIGPGGRSINFDQVDPQLTAGADISGEWGYTNTGATGLLPNLVSATRGGSTPFGGANLDGPVNLDGPEGGVVTDPPQVGIGGLGGVADSVVITVTLDASLSDLDFLTPATVRVEFGSDAAFVDVPEPATLGLLGAGGCAALVRRRRRRTRA